MLVMSNHWLPEYRKMEEVWVRLHFFFPLNKYYIVEDKNNFKEMSNH